MNILIIDDHMLVLKGLRLQLKELDPDAEIIEASDFDEALHLAEECDSLDLAIVDLAMPGMPWQEGLRRLRDRFAGLRAVILSGTSEIANIRNALELGAVGYIPKDTSGKVLLGALRLVLDGGTYIPPVVMLDQCRGTPPLGETEPGRPVPTPGGETLSRLTPRQREVLPLLSQGLSNKAIARMLKISEATVKYHVSSLIKILNVSNRTQAVYAAVRLSKSPNESANLTQPT